MAITKNANRQELVTAYVEFDLEDLMGEKITASADISVGALTDDVAYTTSITLPVGAVVTGGSVQVLVPFDSASADVVSVGDATDDDRYLNDQDITAIGTYPLVPTGFVHTAAEPAIAIIWNATSTDSTVGRMILTVEYYVMPDVQSSTTIAYGALTSGAAYTTAIALPVGAVVVQGDVTVVTSFNSVTTDVLDVGDVTSANRYLNDGNLQGAPGTVIPLVPTGFVVTATQPAIKVTWTQTGGSTSAGAFTLRVVYYVPAVIEAIDLPHNAQVLGGALTITEAFDSETSDSFTVGDAASVARYLGATDGQVEATTALVPTGFKTTGVTPVTVKWIRLSADTGPTEGAARLRVDYMVDKRAAFTQE